MLFLVHNFQEHDASNESFTTAQEIYANNARFVIVLLQAQEIDLVIHEQTSIGECAALGKITSRQRCTHEIIQSHTGSENSKAL